MAGAFLHHKAGYIPKETKWKGSKARNIGGGFKLFYHGVDGKRNGVGVILKEEYSTSVVEVKRVSDRVMIVKVEVEGMMINVISAYAPQVGCEMEEKERFWSELDEVVDGVPRKERLVIGADFNGHVGEGNRGDEEVMGRYGFKERNVEGQMVVDFAKRMEMAVVNTYFKKKEDHRVTYKSGGKCTQVDYVLCRRCNLKEIGDCKVLAGDSVARQHRMVVCRMVLEAKKKRRRVRTERRIRWWKLKEEECSVRFREEVRQGLSGVKEVLDDWATTAGVMREAARKVLGVTSGNRKEDKETWWWNEEVQESIRRKRLAKQKWDRQSDEKSRQEYKEMRQQPALEKRPERSRLHLKRRCIIVVPEKQDKRSFGPETVIPRNLNDSTAATVLFMMLTSDGHLFSQPGFRYSFPKLHGVTDQLYSPVVTAGILSPSRILLNNLVKNSTASLLKISTPWGLKPHVHSFHTSSHESGSIMMSDFMFSSATCHLQKFSDDSAIVSLIMDDDDRKYRGLIQNFVDWCQLSCLQINTWKT
ncbi:hypothetical protein C0J50_11338 [Silurus asotus]|uniref:Craniofacial development protein 2 n=1 Tax=Silurus asotus TaxID=30991 RepID=A0AAD5FE72_SILAS|nr:hypothetical protein C0J50_11338 [Silurus asotus]